IQGNRSSRVVSPAASHSSLHGARIQSAASSPGAGSDRTSRTASVGPSSPFPRPPVLETQDGIISKTNLVSFPFQSGLHHVLEPHIECVMQVDVGQERTDRLPLSRPCFAHEQFAVFDDSDLDPFLNQAEHAAVTYALLHHLDKASPLYFVEVFWDFQPQTSSRGPGADHLCRVVQSLMLTASGPKPVRAIEKI